MKSLQWILEETVLALQERLLSDFGGSSGVRDANLLASALARPKNLFAYDKPGLFQLAEKAFNEVMSGILLLGGFKIGGSSNNQLIHISHPVICFFLIYLGLTMTGACGIMVSIQKLQAKFENHSNSGKT